MMSVLKEKQRQQAAVEQEDVLQAAEGLERLSQKWIFQLRSEGWCIVSREHHSKTPQAGWLETMASSSVTIVETRSPKLKWQQSRISSETLNRILPCLFVASGWPSVPAPLDLQLVTPTAVSVVTQYSPHVSLMTFFNGQQSDWIKGSLYSNMSSSQLMTSTMTLFPNKVTF